MVAVQEIEETKQAEQPQLKVQSEAQAEMWGDILPGTVFWQESKAPENSALLDETSRATKLDPRKLKEILAKKQRYEAALAEWDYRSYPVRLRYHRHMIQQCLEAGNKAEAREWKKKLKSLEAAKPANPEQKKILWFIPVKPKFLPIANETEAQKLRLWLDNAEKRLKEHQTAIENERLYDELAHEMLLEIGYFGQQMVKRWAALGQREEWYIDGKKRRKYVKFEEAHYTPDEIQYKILVSSRNLIGMVNQHLPDRVSAWNLVKPETLAELSAACERPVTSPNEENTPIAFERGAWITINREGLTDGLFDYVDYERVITKYEPEKRHLYPIPIGVKRGRIVHWLYLSKTPHLMVNGVPGSGKTNMIRVILTALCQYHSPDEFRFYIVDLKRGGDFTMFSESNHLAAPIIKDIGDLAAIVPQLVGLMQNRMDRFSAIGAVDIDEFNRMVGQEKRMPRVMIVIDECNSIDNLAFKADTRQIIWRGLTLIATQARAAGIHLCLGTQQTSGEAIPARVRDNITFALSGRQRTQGASMSTFGSAKAKKLPAIRGRMMCDDGSDEFQIQTPEVKKETIEKAIAISQAYGAIHPLELPSLDENAIAEIVSDAPFTMEDVARISITENDGRMSQHKIYAHPDKPQHISRNKIKALIDEIVSLRNIQFEGKTYSVQVSGSGHQLILNTEIQENTEQPSSSSDSSQDGSSAINENAAIQEKPDIEKGSQE